MSLPIDDTVSLPIILAWLRMNWGKILLGGIVFALIAFLWVQIKPKTYESSAMLLVFPPAFKNSNTTVVRRGADSQFDSIAEMMPRALPVEAYKAIALSPPLLDEVIHRVPLQNTGIQTLQKQLEVELVQLGSRGSQGVVYTQTLMFHAKAQSPELAAKTAQTWADVFKERVDEVAAKGAGDTFSLLDTLHRNTKSELERAERALAEHEKAWNLDLIKAQLEAKQTQLTEFDDELKQTEVDLASAEMRHKALDEELAKEPQKNVYFRAPSDDAYWIAGLQNGGEPKIKPDQGLRTEEANENYVEIRGLVVTAKEDLEGLRATRDTILLKLDELKKEIEALTATFADKTMERNKLTRESDSLEDSYAVVRAEYEKGRMADRTRASDIVITGKAAVPARPSEFSSGRIVFLAALAGMFVTGGFLLLKEISDMAPRLGARGLAALIAQAPGRASDEPAIDSPTQLDGDSEKPV